MGCRKRGQTYRTKCRECKKEGKVVQYVGESCRSSYERQGTCQ